VTRELPPLPDEERPDDGPEPPAGHVGTTRPGPLVVLALTGLILGWRLRPLSIRWSGTAPTVGWAPALALLLAAVILGAVAWSTYRSLHPRRPGAGGGRGRGRFHPQAGIEPQHAVNRLVLAKSSALVGALVGGGYLGYALSWWGVGESPLAQQRMVQALVAGAGGVLIVAASLLLERACRVRDDGAANLP
jgi:hypothetical protein